MDCVTVRGLSFSYPGQDGPVLRDVSFSLEKGEFAVLCGPSGCGKSTLLRQLKSVLAPHGDLQGEILFEGRPLQEVEAREQAAAIGFVQQSPDNQIVTDRVWHELAFGPHCRNGRLFRNRALVSQGGLPSLGRAKANAQPGGRHAAAAPSAAA